MPHRANEKFTGLALILGQVQHSNRIFSQNVGPTFKIWAHPVDFSLQLLDGVHGADARQDQSRRPPGHGHLCKGHPRHVPSHAHTNTPPRSSRGVDLRIDRSDRTLRVSLFCAQTDKRGRAGQRYGAAELVAEGVVSAALPLDELLEGAKALVGRQTHHDGAWTGAALGNACLTLS